MVLERGEGGSVAGLEAATGKARARIAIESARWLEREAGETFAWGVRQVAPEKVEQVALSHLVRFAQVALANLESRVEPLPPPDGSREVLQVHGKGRWFFGEIEEAQSRVEPFTNDRHLREMDALADAAGLYRQEIRLANFFPELFHCSGFALHGAATVDGRIYHGRVRDYLRGLGLEENAVVMIVKPDKGNAWVNVGYAGFVGTVTAMNAKQVAIGEMGGRGEGEWDGKPMAQLMRETMERADTIDEAVEIMRRGPRTCEYYSAISDAKAGRAVGIKATPGIFETVWSGEAHPELPRAVPDTVILSAGSRYETLVDRIEAGYGSFDADSAIALMERPVCMNSNIQSVLFAPDTLDFWVANADSDNVASHTRYRHYNLGQLLGLECPPIGR